MTQTKQHCSTPDHLLTFLRGQLSAREEADFQQHLDDCISCRERLESTAADACVWNEAKEFFANGALHASARTSSDEHEETHQESQRIRQVLDSLRPTDDPASLGRIGGYEVTGVVGAGGMGVVLRAHDRSLDRIVAIKIMAPHLASSGSARKRFAREAKAAAAVLHPNVIAIHSVASEDANPYLVMPFVRGAALQKRIDSQGPLPLKDTLRIGAQIAAGLAAAHEQGLVHRDIKPANILLEEGVERVTITDFGLARAVDDASMTCSGVIAGTPQYMSPEQARGEPIDARSDLFSLGGVLYSMCTGRSPFRAETAYGVLHRIANDKPTPVCEVNSDVPAWLGHVIERLMAKRPDDRFESASQIAELLEGCLAHAQQPAVMLLPEAVTALAPTKARRPRVGKFISAAAGLFGLLFAGILIVLELNKGTLTIESEMDDVPIRIMQGNTVVEKMTVTKSGNAVRVAAGTYVVELETKLDGMVVENDQVSLKRGETERVKIRYANPVATETTGKNKLGLIKTETGWRINDVFYGLKAETESVTLQGEWEFISVESDGVITEYKTPGFRLKVAADVWTVQGGDGIPTMSSGGHRVEIDGNKLTFHGMTTMPGLGSNEEIPTIGYGLFELDGDALTYLMTPAVAESSLNGQGQSPIKSPVSFETKGTQNNVYRLQRIQASTPPIPGSSINQTPSKSSPEFPHVKIVVHDEEGRPLEGVKVRLYQSAKDLGGQALEINETSNASGTAVDRNLPYGHYALSATTADGWYLTGYRSRLNVEFEKGLDVILVAPTPGKTSKLAISSGITTSPDKISGLRFGGLQKKEFTAFAPEPEGSNPPVEQEFSSFPTIANGIEYVGAEIRLNVTRNVSQAAPSMQHVNTSWDWISPSQSKVSSRYLIANGQARSFAESYTAQNESLERLPVEGSEFFELPNPKYCVGAELLKLREPTELPLELDIPTGNVKVTVSRFLGKPSAPVMAALNWRLQEPQSELWLEAHIAPDSAWAERLINMDWINSPIRSIELRVFPPLWREQALGPGERLEISLGKKQDQSQPALGKTLQQLQGKWKLSRHIAPDGDKNSMPSHSEWEFNGNSYVVQDSGPGGAGLIEVDDSQSPAHVKLTISNDQKSGLGLLSIEGDKAVFVLGKPQEAPDPNSRPEKLQWVEGAFYMELTRINHVEAILPVPPKVESPMPRNSQSEAETPNPMIATETTTPAIDHRNSRSVVEAYVALALAGDVAKAASLAKNSPADPKRIRELPEFLNVQRLKIETVYINDATKPSQALATSVAVQLDKERKNPDGRRDGFMVFTLELSDEKWFVIDIDFETDSGAEKELNEFLKANPNSIGIPPRSQGLSR